MFLRNDSKAKKTLIVLLLCFFSITLFPPVVSAGSIVDIFGYVRDDDTGKPIYNARVDLFYERDSEPFISIYSDYNGRIDASIYAAETIKRAEITRTGYRRAQHAIQSYSRSIDLGTRYLVAGTTGEGKYKVYGRVLDDRDDAYISNARVVLVDDYEDIAYTGYTDSRGYFDVTGLPLGDFEVSVTKYGYKDYEMRDLLRLRIGDYDLGNIRMERTGAVSSPSTRDRALTGRVKDEDGYYLQDAEVYLIDSAGEEIKTKTDARGYYTFLDIAAKTYTIGVNAVGYELLERIDFVRIASDDGEREVNLVVKRENRRGHDVYGRVVDENRDYLEDVEVSLIDGNTRIKRVLTDAKGYYEFRYVSDGRYALEFKKLGYQTKRLDDEVRVDGSYYPVSQVELKEKKGSSTVGGGLVGDEQAGLYNVTVYLEDGVNSYSAKTNYYGFFTFYDVKEGIYNLYATVHNTKKLLETGVRVTGTRTDVGDININKVESGYRITGNVRDTAYYDIGNAKITVTAVAAGGIKREAVTDSSGYYSLSGLERGEYTISVSREGYSAIDEKIVITSYDLDKDFILRPNDYVKASYTAIDLAVNERVDLNKYISKVEIYSSRGALLDTITSHYEVTVPTECADYLTAYSNNEILGKKAGEACVEISIRNSRDYVNLSPALLKVTVAETLAAREAVLTIGTSSYTVDGERKTSDAVPYLKEGRSFFPLRVMGGVLGVIDENIEWDPATRTATLSEGVDTVEFTVGEKNYKHNGTMKTMDAQAENVKDRIYLPARFVCNALGGEIEWKDATKTLIIRTNR